MTLVLARVDRQPERTLGGLFVAGRFESYTLEDAVRDGPKVPGRTAIPAGRYRMALTFSQRFQRVLPVLEDVPGFTGIRIHAGNTEADTEGCILVGRTRAFDSVRESQLALDGLMAKLQAATGEVGWLEIVQVRGG